ncbi:trans-resveratrol di-O-methyltransferase-like [Gossypium australe]|uniref:Trans-resveratrol di-O-methyltransferase-like n=1 Tax=Gossypium australe TaxID=47621 RepID=A0A5B6WFA2_9ROSI|nr:trans-resveratrol di-O-methyltransferase-like [Gossypium australe]
MRWRKKRKEKNETERGRGQVGTDDISPHIQDFCIRRYPERKEPRRETEEEMLGNLNINVISEEGIGGENLSNIRPYVPGSILNNWTVEEIPIVFRDQIESPDINDMSDITTDSESPFEQDLCTEDS